MRQTDSDAAISPAGVGEPNCCLSYAKPYTSISKLLFDLISFQNRIIGVLRYLIEGFLQCAAFLEVVHGAVGLVPSGALLPLMQWGGRTHFVLVLVRRLDEVQELPSIFVTFLAWSISQVIRYSHYAFSCLGNCPSWITYLRYSAFIVLYPLGKGLGEMWVMYQALPIIKKKNLYADSFSGLPFSYYDFLKVVLLVYPFLWSKLHLHLFKQRHIKLYKYHDKKRA